MSREIEKTNSGSGFSGFEIPQLEGEPDEAYIAFCDFWRKKFRTIGQLERFYRARRLDEEPGFDKTSNLRTWFYEYRWSLRKIDADKLFAEWETEMWAKKKAESRRKDYEQGSKLRRLADEILSNAPSFYRTRIIKNPDGSKTKIVALNIEAALAAIKLGSNIQSRATGGDRPEINVMVQNYTVQANPDQWPSAPVEIIEGSFTEKDE